MCRYGRVQTVKEHALGVFDAGKLDADLLGVKYIFELTAKLHDMGKNTPESDEYQRTVGLGNEWKKDKIIHSTAGAKFIFDRYVENNDKKDKYDILLSEIISIAIMSHHGLFDSLEPCNKSAENQYCNNKFIRRIKNTNYNYEESKNITFLDIISLKDADGLYQKAKYEFMAIYNKIKGNYKNQTILDFRLGMLERMLLSVLVNADHTNAAEFSAQERIITVYGNKEIWKSCFDYLESKIANFKISSNIAKIRSEISKKALNASTISERIVRMSVPTGGGKTISSLRFAVNHCLHFNKSRIFYVAPFNSILEQNSKELKAFLPDDIFVLEHFGEVISYEDNANNVTKYFTENWGAPVIATSMVQFLNTLFNGTITSVRRMRSLINSVIVIDEIQSLPVECTSLFNMAVNFLAEVCNATVILCSATQPVLDKVKYNVSLGEKCEMIGDFENYCQKLKRTEIVDKLKPSGYTYYETAEFLFDISKNNKSVLCVVNTKYSAVSIYKLFSSIIEENGLKDDYHIMHLSTNMCPAHRKLYIDELKEYLKGNKKVVCISTQLIEAGVDISFCTVIRSLAGLDSIIQAAGRCNRNCENFLGYVYVIDISEENVTNLKSILYGQKITRSIIMNMRANPLLFGGDISSPQSINHYYDEFYKACANELDYKIKNEHYTLVDLLSANKIGVEIYKIISKERQRPQLFMKQAFKTAGDKFEVINNNSLSVLVPYGKGKKLIEMITSGIDLSQLNPLISEIQKYTIGVSKKFEKSDYIVKDEFTGISILKDGFYSNEFGLTEEVKLELLGF